MYVVTEDYISPELLKKAFSFYSEGFDGVPFKFKIVSEIPKGQKFFMTLGHF